MISRLRLATLAIAAMAIAAVGNSATAQTEGYVTTHVLDAAQGRPAAGMHIDLFRNDGKSRELVRSVETNADGRTDSPVIAKGGLAPGTFELLFHTEPA